ncbi:uncharacterized protein LOC134812032 [Bolinopsis microptera]|uniref:uncharacterized protein LOC134812031 n=1 Tax=Bolinopsis microptera TaxID=2820187 RepID=UPI003079919C
MVCIHAFTLTLLACLVVLVVSDESCTDLYPRSCKKWEKKGFCEIEKHRPALREKCRRTCNFCAVSRCFDLVKTDKCEEWLNLGLCEEGKVSEMCSMTCGSCSSDDDQKCPTLSIRNGRFPSIEEAYSKQKGNLRVDISGVITAGTEVRIECDTGFQLMGSSQVQCLENGQYDGELGVCIRDNECEVPTYGHTYNKLDRYFLVSEPMGLEKNTVSPGTYAILVCQNGRKQQSFCSSFGTWLPPIRDCDDESAEWSRWYELNTISKRHHLAGSMDME